MRVVIAHGGNIGFPRGGTNRVLVFAKAHLKMTNNLKSWK